MIEDTARAIAIAVGLLVFHFWDRLRGYVDHFIVHDALWPLSGRGNVVTVVVEGVVDKGKGLMIVVVGVVAVVVVGGSDGGGRRKGVSGRGRSSRL